MSSESSRVQWSRQFDQPSQAKLPQPTLSSLTEREAVRNFLITKVQQLEKRVLSATAKPPSRSPFLASVDRCRHPGRGSSLQRRCSSPWNAGYPAKHHDQFRSARPRTERRG